MSKKLKVLLAAGLVTAGTGITAALTMQSFAETGTSTEVAVSSDATSDHDNKLIDETVYVFTKADGSTRKIITSDWTKNLDVDEYTNFRNDEKKTPIELSVSYWLNGEKISAEELAGKSGKVTVRYEFSNNELVNGYYVPYAVVSGIVLNNEHFSNVEAKNAKIVNDGDRTVVTGVTMPGLQEDLGISKAQVEIPNYIEFTADTTDFAMGMTVSVATNEVFQNIDASSLDSVSALESQLNQMSDAMGKLVDGSSELTAGLDTLYKKASTLPDGVATLAAGANQLSLGAAKLDAGIDSLSQNLAYLDNKGTELLAGAEQLSAIFAQMPEQYRAAYEQFYAGLKQYTGGVSQMHAAVSGEMKEGSAELAGGAKQLAGGLDTLNESAPTLVDGIAQLRDGSAKLSAGVEQFDTEAVQKLVNFYNGDVKSLVARIQEIARVAKNNSTSTKYIFRTDEIKK